MLNTNFSKEISEKAKTEVLSCLKEIMHKKELVSQGNVAEAFGMGWIADDSMFKYLGSYSRWDEREYETSKKKILKALDAMNGGR